MGDTTEISWTNVTWNPVQGCTKVSKACQFCYMYRDKLRYGQDPSVVVRSSPQTFNRPLAKYGARATKGTPGAYKWPDGTLVFSCSWSDWFHKDADAHRREMWDVVRQRPGLIFQILTKRADRIADHLPPDWGDGWANVWLGVTVENEETTDRARWLQRVPATVRFISAEPLLGPTVLPLGGIHWVISGGESGPKARPTHPQWLRNIRDQCRAADVAYHHKQNGEFAPVPDDDEIPRDAIWMHPDGSINPPGAVFIGDDGSRPTPADCANDETPMYRYGKKAAGRLLDGRTWDEFPEVTP